MTTDGTVGDGPPRQHDSQQDASPSSESPSDAPSSPPADNQRRPRQSLVLKPLTAVLAIVTSGLIGSGIGYGYAVLTTRLPPADIADAISLDEPIGVAIWNPNRNPRGYAWAGSDRTLEASPSGTYTLPNAPTVPAYADENRVLLRGRRNQPVTIFDIHVDVLKRATPLTGWLAYSGPGGGSEDDIPLSFDVDDPQLVLKGDDNIAYFSIHPHHIALNHDETVTLDMLAFASKSYAEWVLQVTYSIGDQQPKQLTIDREGVVAHGSRAVRPFTITALAPATSYGVLLSGQGGGSYQRVTAAQFCAKSLAFETAACRR